MYIPETGHFDHIETLSLADVGVWRSIFVRLYDLCLFGFIGFLFLLVSGKGCGLWLWHSLDFSLTFFCKVSYENTGTDTMRSTPSPQHRRERQTNTIKQPQNDQTVSRVGNSFPKKWELSYIKLTKYIISLHNYKTLRKHAYSNVLKIIQPKKENFQIKFSDIFHISAQNIHCGYSLEPPRRGGSNEYPQSMFQVEIRKIMYTPVNPSFTI